MNIGDVVVCINNKCLRGNDVAPSLKEGQEYTIKDIIFDSKNNPHFDVGLPSNVNYVRSWDTEEKLPKGDEIHWCHPSRFKQK
jgi:hypothetical protein